MPFRAKKFTGEAATLQNFVLNNIFLAVLVEEVGECGKALQGEGNLQEELIQVASVCIRWLEHMKSPAE